MNHPAAYTHLESLLLYEAVLEEGVDEAAWARISERLSNNAFVKADGTFDAARLRSEPLQNLFFRILQQELWGDSAQQQQQQQQQQDGASPMPTLKTLADNVEKVPTIVGRLWERYKAHMVKLIRDDEEQYDKIQMEIRVLEKNESERLKRLASQSGQPALAPREVKPAPTPTGATTSPVAAQAPPVPIKRGPTPTTPVSAPKTPSSGIAPPSHLPQGTPTVRPPQTAQAGTTPGSVLQAPQGINQQPSRVLQAPSPAPKVPISPRPDAAKPKDGTTAPAAGPPAQGTLKWEKPYQPPGTAQPPIRPSQQPAPPKAATPQQYAQNQQQQWQQQQHQQQHQQQQQQQAQYYQQQGQVTAPQQQQTAQTAQAQPTQGKPVLVPPQNAGNVVPQIQPGPPRPTGTAPSPQPRPQSKTPVPPPHRHIQPHQPQPAQQPRPIASASPTPSTPTGGFAAPPQRFPQAHVSQAQGKRGSPSPAPQKDKPFASPYGTQGPRPAIPEHIIRHTAAGTPTMRRTSTAAPTPTTPQPSPLSVVRGFGTKWAPQSTPSTPGPLNGDPASPAYEPVSPPQRPAALQSTPKPEPPKPAELPSTSRPTRGKQERVKKLRDAGGTPTASKRKRSESEASGADELSLDHPDTMTKIKDEVSTPRPHEEGGDTTADESVPGRGSLVTPGSVSRFLKRKRQDTPPEPVGPPTHVLWTRGFTKVSSSALDQISSHRDGNMFATAVRERDAPNYRQIVLQPQSITSIRSAIKQGNKAAVQAASSLPSGDPGATSVWLPISEDLTPPKGIINSAQLERELVHMFCNAIMYNPDPDRGVGQRFLRRSQEEEEEAFGYRMDENGVVRNTQSMFIEVEKLLGDLRAAEKDRTGPPPLSTPRPASVATPADDTAEEEDELAADGEATSGTTAKRRRTTMRP